MKTEYIDGSSVANIIFESLGNGKIGPWFDKTSVKKIIISTILENIVGTPDAIYYNYPNAYHWNRKWSMT